MVSPRPPLYAASRKAAIQGTLVKCRSQPRSGDGSSGPATAKCACNRLRPHAAGLDRTRPRGPMRRGLIGTGGPAPAGRLETQAALYSRESGGAGRRPRLTISEPLARLLVWPEIWRFWPRALGKRCSCRKGIETPPLELTAISSAAGLRRRASGAPPYFFVRAGLGLGSSRPGGRPGGAGRPGKYSTGDWRPRGCG